MRTVGHRKEQALTFSASAKLLAEGAHFNDEIHRLPTGNTSFTPKGVYFFRTANRHQMRCLVEGMARVARDRT